jgi:cysteine desulfurase
MKDLFNEPVSYASQDKEEINRVDDSFIYLDNNATTKVSPVILQEMMPLFQEKYGNPSSIHHQGNKAKELLETARDRVSSFLNCKADHIIFTSGGTESNNLAIIGFAKKLETKRHFITSNVEHPSVLEVFRSLESSGHHITYLPVDREGLISPGQMEEAITADTALISLMMANNETGVIFPIKELAKTAKNHGIPFHCDAVQGAGKIPIDVEQLGVDFLTISAHKLHGPKGVGALYVAHLDTIEPIIWGGGQEKGKRSGTEALPAIVGLGKACEMAMQNLPQRVSQITALRDQLEQGILDLIPGTYINGNKNSRLCNTSNICFPRIQSTEVLEDLSRVGICVSHGSACSACHGGGSHVLEAMGLPDADIDASLRFSLSTENTEDEVDRVLDILPGIVEKARQPGNSETQCQTCQVAASGAPGGKQNMVSVVSLIPGLERLHTHTTGDPKVCIAVLDGPVDLNHPCFSGAQLSQVESFAARGGDPKPVTNHGTHIASILFGQPNTQMPGIAPRCKGLIVPIYEEIDGKIKSCSQTDLAEAITQVVEMGAHIINISGGQFENSGEADVTLTRAIELCVKRGVLVVAATGNNGCSCHQVPASMPDVLAVGAMNDRGEPMAFSNWGEKYLSHGILAPGENIPGAKPGGGVTYGSATSYAAPIVSGIIALLMSIRKSTAKKPILIG